MKTTRRYLMAFLTVGGVVLTLLGTPARGQGVGYDRGPYLNFGGGMNLMSAEIGADAGIRLSAAGGYNFTRWVGLEIETGYLYNSVRPGRFLFGADDSGPSVSLSQVPLMLNFVVRYENESKIVPYVGFGLGGDFVFTDHGTGFDFAYQPMLGVRYSLNERMSVGVDYRYLGFVSSIIWGVQLGNHGIMVDFNWKF